MSTTIAHTTTIRRTLLAVIAIATLTACSGTPIAATEVLGETIERSPAAAVESDGTPSAMAESTGTPSDSSSPPWHLLPEADRPTSDPAAEYAGCVTVRELLPC